jgi:hypothetical protein
MTHKSYSSGFGSFPNPTPVDKEKKTIKIEVNAGVVTNVENLPEGYDYEIVDHDLEEEEDKPEGDKVYALTGGPGQRCIANGNTWKDSEVEDA